MNMFHIPDWAQEMLAGNIANDCFTNTKMAPTSTSILIQPGEDHSRGLLRDYTTSNFATVRFKLYYRQC